MEDLNEHKPGYKETKVGWIPMDWECSRLKELVTESQLGGNYAGSLQAMGVPLIKMGNMGRGHIVLEKVEKLAADCTFEERDVLVCGDFLFNTRNTLELVGKTCLWRGELEKAVFNSNILRLSFRESRIASSDFACRVFNSNYGLRQLRSFAIGTTSVAAIYWRDLKQFILLIPPLPEQKKITEILSRWDEAIEQTRKLIEAKKHRKKGLMQQLLTGKNRLPGFKRAWGIYRLSSIVRRLTTPPKKPDSYPVLSITAGTGFVSQADKFSRVIAGRNIERYVLLRRGGFSYNKGNSKRYPQGCTYQQTAHNAGIVPNVFYSFRVINDSVAPEFVEYWFLAGLHNHQLSRWINTGVRNDGLLNLNASDFFNLPIYMPEDRDEQEAIGDVLRAASDEIVNLDTKLKALEKQKRGLMQKLLTGTVRVKT